MKIYLDTCSLQRPLDSKTQVRIVLESEAVLGLLALCEMGDLELISSEALVFEMERNPNSMRRRYAMEVLSKSKVWIEVDRLVEERARELVLLGFRPLDALHLASAEVAQADYFCTCDDRLLKRGNVTPGIRTNVKSPVDVIGEIEEW